MARAVQWVCRVALAILAGGPGLASAQPASAPATPPVVVELFTSQSCNSCPPADAFLADLAKRPGVLALSFHVDYWDYIGWRDPFAQRGFTERQRGYSRTLPLRYVYTPQIVVDGRLQDVGSERKKIEALIARAANEAVKHVALRVTGAAPNIKLEIDGNDGASPAKPATVWLVAYDHVRTTKITRGENAGLSLDNYNVVRRMRSEEHTSELQSH